MIYAMMVVGTILLAFQILAYSWKVLAVGLGIWIIYFIYKTFEPIPVKNPESEEDDKDDKTPPKDPPKLYTGAI